MDDTGRIRGRRQSFATSCAQCGRPFTVVPYTCRSTTSETPSLSASESAFCSWPCLKKFFESTHGK